MVDEHAFFHAATMRICSSLDISESVANCYEFLQKYIPIEGLYINIYEPELKSIRILAAHGGDFKTPLTNQLIPLDEKGVSFVEHTSEHLEELERVMFGRLPDSRSIATGMQERIGFENGSYMVLHLSVKEVKLGVLVVSSSRENAFAEKHRDLLALLHDPFAIALSNAVRFREVLRYKEMLNDENLFLRKELLHITGDEIVGREFGLREVMTMVAQVANLDSNVLLFGETGTGKEVIAGAIHHSSDRADGPMIRVNCGAIAESILDSELFGHEKGAFTGAVEQKRGRFERAHKGTIFLDEVAELPPAAQVRLLRVIQTKQIERVGGSETVPVDVRIIAATHRNLTQMVREGKFREDLWFRLNVFPITIPPLRMRKIDIPALVEHFVQRKAKEMNLSYVPPLAKGALGRLHAHDWPGNVRELENAVERELIRAQAAGPGAYLGFYDLNLGQASVHAPKNILSSGFLPDLTLDQAIRAHIEQAMKKCRGKVQGPDGAAALLGLHPSTLRNRMRKLGIPFGRAKT
jgi:transcriptional regulator with GAF, ATPase, and Fis domain